MLPRIRSPHSLAPQGIRAMMALEESVRNSGLDPVLMELVKLRASQINRCAFCIHMHATDLRKMGESEMRLYLLDAWRDSSLYTPRERAALGWTEALTCVADTGAPDPGYEALQAEFSDAEQVQLTLLIGAINAVNRLQIGFRVAHLLDRARAAPSVPPAGAGATLLFGG